MTPESGRPPWQKITAGLVAAGVIVAIVVWRDRIGADFWPLDSSRVGPNLLASIVQWAVIFCAAVLLWPPWRRRLHRFVDRKVAPLHSKLNGLHASHKQLHARHDEHAEHLVRLGRSIQELHNKLDRLTRDDGDYPRP